MCFQALFGVDDRKCKCLLNVVPAQGWFLPNSQICVLSLSTNTMLYIYHDIIISGGKNSVFGEIGYVDLIPLEKDSNLVNHLQL